MIRGNVKVFIYLCESGIVVPYFSDYTPRLSQIMLCIDGCGETNMYF